MYKYFNSFWYHILNTLTIHVFLDLYFYIYTFESWYNLIYVVAFVNVENNIYRKMDVAVSYLWWMRFSRLCLNVNVRSQIKKKISNTNLKRDRICSEYSLFFTIFKFASLRENLFRPMEKGATSKLRKK